MSGEHDNLGSLEGAPDATPKGDPLAGKPDRKSVV